MSRHPHATGDIKEFDRAIDLAYLKVIRAARAEWERRFGGKDPSDASVSVRIHGGDIKPRAVASSGFLKASPKKRLPSAHHRRIHVSG